MTETATQEIQPRNIWLSAFSLGVGVVGLLALVLSSRAMSWRQHTWWMLFFVLLSMTVKRSGFHVAPKISHSLVGVVDVSVLFIFGSAVGGWVAALSAGLYLLLNALRHGRWQRRTLIELPLFSCGLKALMALASGAVYQLAGGKFPLSTITLPNLFPPIAVFVTWFTLNHLGLAIWTWLLGGAEELNRFLHSVWPTSFLVEFLPLPAAALIAPVFAWDWLPFLIFAIGLVVVSVVVQRLADALQQLEDRVGELSAVAETGRAIVEAQLDVDQLCDLIYQQVSRIVDTSSFHLGLFEDDKLTLKVWVVAGQRRPSQTFDFAAGEGIVGWMRRTRQPLLVRDFEQEMDTLPAHPRYTSENPPHSAVFVPLVAGEQVIGTMTIQSFQPAAYTQDHVRILSLMANQAAAAIVNAQLFERELLRARQLALVGQVSRQVAAITELDTLFRQVAHLIHETFGYYHAGIFTLDPRTETLVFQAGTDLTNPLKDYTCEIGEGIIGWVALKGKPLLANDVSQEPRYRFAAIWPETRAELAVPLLVENEVVGVLDVQSDRTNAFSDDDVFVLQALSAQVAVAIGNASLYNLERRRRQTAEIQRELAQVLSSTIELEQLLNLVLVLVAQAIECDVALTLLRDGETLTVRAAQGLSSSNGLVGLSFTPGQSPCLDRLSQAQHPVILFDPDHPPAESDLLDALLGLKAESGLGVPLLVQEESRGGLLLLSETPELYTQEDAQAAFIFASQAALAIENARLYAAQQEEAWVSTALLQVAEAVSSLNTLDEILSTITRIMPILVGVDCCAILLWNEQAQVFEPAQQYGLSPSQTQLFWQLQLSPQTLGMAEGEPDSPPTADDLMSLLSAQSYLMLPLQTRGEILGLMVIGYADEPEPGSERRTNILTGIANQTAIAVESEQLAREAANQERLTRELEVAQEIQASFLPEEYPDLPGWQIAAHWGAARRVGGDFYDFLRLPNDHLGLVIADVADKGIPAALFMALSRTLVRVSALTGRGPAQALERANQLILSDARSDLFVTIFYAVIDPATGQMIYTSAGHNPPLLVHANGEVETLHCPGIALGVLEEIQLREKETYLNDGDVLILYTDGITEAINADVEEFGIERLAEIALATRHESAPSILARVDEAVKTFVAGEPQFDDMTCVIAQRVIHQSQV
jgi:serine phosphatase RsbU (regulator of sigma subunit)/putative methionine-R-sulfoxide reductase with GAF domain